jgi:lysophospholipase L1-like esterase
MFRNRGGRTPKRKPAWIKALGPWQFAGDSITADANPTGNRSGYKERLAREVYEDTSYIMRADEDIVGIQNPNGTVNTYPYCGLSGIRTDQLLTTYVGTGKDSLNAALFRPGLVILNIGTNDALQGYTGSEGTVNSHITTQIGLIIDAYKVANPDVKVVVCNLFDNNNDSAALTSASAAITAAIQARGDYEASSFIFDSFAAMGPYTLTYWQDGTHLRNAGNNVFAEALYARLQELFS